MSINVDLISEIGVFNRLWRSLMEQKLRELGVTQARWVTLWWVTESKRPLNQKELARRIGIEGPSLVRQLDALEQMGLIERVVDRDRRARLISVTPKARPVMKKIKQMAEDLSREALAGIDPTSVPLCLNLVRSMREHLDTAREPAAAASDAPVATGLAEI